MTGRRNTLLLVATLASTAQLGACSKGSGHTSVVVPPGGPTNYPEASTACAAEAFPTTGTIVYACDCQTGADGNCVSGNDSNDGTSSAKAFQSYTKVIAQYSAIPAGGTVALCRGGAFTASGIDTTAANNNCKANNPCLLRDYVPTNWTPSADHQPIIHTGASNYGLAINENNSMHQEGFRILNLDLEGDGATNSTGFFLDNDVSDVFACNLTINGMTAAGIVFGGSSSFPANCYSPGPPIVDTCPFQKRITMQGNTITNITQMGFFGYGISIDLNYNHWEKVGTDSSPDHVVYFGAAEIDKTTPMTQVLMQDEHFIGNIVVDAGSAGTCDGTQVVSHGAHDGMVFQNNIFMFSSNTRTGNCFTIGLGAGTNNYPDLYSNLLVDSNTIIGFDNQAITINSCQHCTVSNNLIVNAGDTTDNSICVVSGEPLPEEYDLGTSDTTIVNNTCYLTDAVTNNRGFGIEGQGAGYVLANNVAYFDTTTSDKNYDCYDYHLGSSALVGGSISTSISDYSGITNGGFDITIDGTNRQVTGLNFSSAQNIWDVAVTLSAALNAIVSGAEATWMGSSFTLNTLATNSGPATLSAASAPTAGSGTTDVSRTLGLSAAAGAAVKPTYLFSNNSLCYAPEGPTLSWDYATGQSLSSWTSMTGFDGASQVAPPQFVNAATTGYDFHPATGSPLIGTGTAMYAPKVDITGTTRPSPPNIGAYQ